MATGKTALKEQALATLQAGRREISAEAQWIRNGLNPKRAVQKLARDHTLALALGAVAIGIALPLLLHRSSKARSARALEDAEQLVYDELEKPVRTKARKASKPVKEKVGLGSYLMGLILKTATPFLIQEGLKIAEQFAMSQIKAQTSTAPPYPADQAPS